MVRQEKLLVGRSEKPTSMRYGFRESIAGERLTFAAHYREGRGKEGELVVFIHGLGCNKDSFQDVWKRDDFKEYSVLVPDMVGFGDSSKPDNWPYSLEAHASSLKKLLETPRYQGKKVHIVGHSTGGTVGLLLAAHLEREGREIASITLAEANLVTTDASSLSRTLNTLPFEDVEKKVLPNLIAGLHQLDDPSLQLWGKQIEHASTKALHETAKSLVAAPIKEDLIQKFSKLLVKKLLYIYGRQGERWNREGIPDTNELLEKGFGQYRIPFVGVDGTHFMLNDNPEEFYDLVLTNL